MTYRDPGIVAASRAHVLFGRYDKGALERFAFAVLYVHVPTDRHGTYWCQLCGVRVIDCAINRAADAFLGPRSHVEQPIHPLRTGRILPPDGAAE